MSFLCRAKTNDGEACDCEEYDEPQDPSAPSNDKAISKQKVAGKKKAPNSKPKDTITRSYASPEPDPGRLKHMHCMGGCDRRQDRPDSTYDECTEHLPRFSRMHLLCNTKRKTDSGLWMIVAKNYQTLRLSESSKKDVSIFIDGSQIEDGSSDYDPMKDPDADGLKTAHLPTDDMKPVWHQYLLFENVKAWPEKTRTQIRTLNKPTSCKEAETW
ncbi:hypothetical protein B0H13DRAFT_1925810 [Mycena leptocephala]|nr:hypothetical protein B0H13DRAFT_1925810 [Mycena leptocephala]